MINQFLEEATEQSTTVTSSKSAGRKSSTMLRNGYLEIGDDAIDPALQDNVLLPKGFTEYIYHVWNASELKNSIIRNGFIPGGRKLKRGRQAVFFTTVNPMDD